VISNAITDEGADALYVAVMEAAENAARRIGRGG
jgi:hypothetical protein